MKRTSHILIFLVICLWSESVQSQVRSRYIKKYRTREIGFCIGATNFLGDLGGANLVGSEDFSLRDFDFPAVRPTLGLNAGYQIWNWASLKTGFVVGYIRGNDQFTDYIHREKRNINYRTVVVELSEQFEVYITKTRQGRSSYTLRSAKKKFSFYNFPFTTYLFTGVAGFYFNPQGKDKEGKWQFVKPYHTEGQGVVATRKNYNNFQFAIPFGIGFKYPLGDGYTLGIEYGVRKTFTDYMDDASMTYFDFDYLKTVYGQEAVDLANPTELDYLKPDQQRGDPRDKDSYMFALITLYKDISKISKIRNFRF
jgi:hypothetical protein